MKRLISVALVSLLVGAVACGGGKQTKKDNAAKDEMWGEETGYATIFDEDIALARDRAIDDAMNKLVKVKIGTLVTGKSVVQDYALIESVVEVRSSGMVKDWKITKENRDGTAYIVTLQGRVYPQAVNDTIQATLENYGRPKFMVLVNESFEGKKNAPGMTATELSMMNYMGKSGFEFVDAATVQKLVAEEGPKMRKAMAGSIDMDGDVQSLLDNTGAEVIIVGEVKTEDQTATLKKISPETTMRSKRAIVNNKAIDVYTGSILASVSASGPGIAISDEEASRKAVQNALQTRDVIGKEETGAFVNDIGRKFLMAATRRLIKLNIAGLEYAGVTKFRNQVGERIRGVSKVIPRGTAGKYSVVEIQFAGKSTDFADELSAKADAMGFIVKIEEAYPSKIMMSVKQK